ncbi:MAG: AAA family ATPase [Chloroflexota bacterium]
MATQQQAQATTDKRPGPAGLGRLTVAGYKSLLKPTSIRIAPLTILAGANSSGKSSIMQPVLLMKQTLESSFDPGALLLQGPHVQLTSTDQLFSHCGPSRTATSMSVEIETTEGEFVRTAFERKPSTGLAVTETERKWSDEHYTLRLEMNSDQVAVAMPNRLQREMSFFRSDIDKSSKWKVARNRCFLVPAIEFSSESGASSFPAPNFQVTADHLVSSMLHLPGLRGNPARTYPVTSIDTSFPGPFPPYTASIIANWQDRTAGFELYLVNANLQKLGLTDHVEAKRINDTEVELRVARVLGKSGNRPGDMVSLADVGLGVSQTLPVIVALCVATPGQTVYIEQPEIHLHPRAQFTMADVLIDAANRGVRVVVETHSSITLLGIQAAVAEGRISGQDVALHWFSRDRFGQTQVQSVELGESGDFGDWPEDFSDVYLHAQGRYLDAVERRTLAH